MTNKIKTAILISGRGSNMKSLIKAAQNPEFPAIISLVISNKEDAMGLKIAQRYNIKTEVVNHKDCDSRVQFDKKLNKLIEENQCQVICLAGFMRILSGWFVNKWKGKMINIHPSLLPSFKGANSVEDALNYGVKFSGCSVHFVSEEMDSGPIVSQSVVKVLENDTKETLASRILKKEHIIYKQALENICTKLITK